MGSCQLVPESEKEPRMTVITCRRCGSVNLRKNGHTPSGQQKFHWKDCNAYGTPDLGRPLGRLLNAQSLNLTNYGHLSAPKVSRSGLAGRRHAKGAGLLVVPLAIVAPKHVASYGNRGRLTIANARSVTAISGIHMRQYCPPNAIVRSANKRVKRRISSTLLPPYANAA